MATKEKETPTGEKEQQGREGGRQGLHCGEANPNQRHLFKRETEHLCLRQLIHGIGRDPFARA